MRFRASFFVSLFGVFALFTSPALAIINQVDGVIVPQTDALQTCLDKRADLVPTAGNPAPGEGPGVLNAVANAAITPQTFVPSVRADGRRIAQFTMVGEGAGYQNRFGWYNVGDSPFVAASRRQIFSCRDLVAACDCPCPAGPRAAIPADSACTHWVNPNIVEIDFDCQRSRGAWRGGPIAFYIVTPEALTDAPDINCPAESATDRRVYSTDNSINDDGDYVHFLIYSSRTFRDGYYFGWEDLFRGGDNDFEDVLVRTIGMVPACNPVPEVCDGRDNNCNGMIDDGLGTSTCGLGACMRTVNTCLNGVVATCTPGPATAEVCDNVDNNCNGTIDEGVSRACNGECGAGTQYCSAGAWGDCVSTAPLPEVCDNRDNDCNGRIDDGLSRPCTTSCGSGREVCAAGAWGSCSAPSPATEVCDGVDNDCDGMVDEGVPARPCEASELRCGPGMAVCVGGRFVCNAPQPRPEVCDGRDNDCDGTVDNGIPSAGTCGLAQGVCRAGTFECRGGRFVCTADETMRRDETCDGLDNNCNGLIDEGNPGGGASCMTGADGAPLCRAGTLRCRAGRLACEGGVMGTPERCNCMDDDCDGMIDEDAPGAGGLCPGGGRCVACQCRTPCLPGEFPCSVGLACNSDNFCVPPLCGTEICSPTQICQANRCVDQCAAVTCPAGQVCNVRDGRASCVENNCYGLGCTGSQLCRAGACVNNGCADRTCPAGQFCRPGPTGAAQCVPTCATTQCPPTQSCLDGACVADPCQGVRCDVGTLCVAVGGRGVCQPDPCQNIGAQPGRVCRNGMLVDDPCTGVVCGGGSNVVCRNGQCIDPTLTPLIRDRVVGSGGSCSVAAPGVATSRGTWLLAAGAVLGALGRRRRRRSAVAGGAR